MVVGVLIMEEEEERVICIGTVRARHTLLGARGRRGGTGGGARHATAAGLAMEDWLKPHDFHVPNVTCDLHSASRPAFLVRLSRAPSNTPTPYYSSCLQTMRVTRPRGNTQVCND